MRTPHSGRQALARSGIVAVPAAVHRPRWPVLLLSLALAGCMSLAPDYAAPKIETPADVELGLPAEPWWQQSGDATLAALIEEINRTDTRHIVSSGADSVKYVRSIVRSPCRRRAFRSWAGWLTRRRY